MQIKVTPQSLFEDAFINTKFAGIHFGEVVYADDKRKEMDEFLNLFGSQDINKRRD